MHCLQPLECGLVRFSLVGVYCITVGDQACAKCYIFSLYELHFLHTSEALQEENAAKHSLERMLRAPGVRLQRVRA